LEAKLDKEQVRAVYRRMAAHYDTWSRLAESKARQRCLELAAIRNGEAILEVAVGTGILFEQVLQENPNGRNEGIDLTEEILAYAKMRAEKTGASNYNLKVGDAYQLSFPDSSFDVLLNNYMFDLIPEKDFLQILPEFKRVLRPGGRIVLANMTLGTRWFNTIWDWLYRLNPALLGGCRGIELGLYLQCAGFEEIRREYISQFGFPSEVIYAVKPNHEVDAA
jgi:ubiquinone/menaquinone biosynthesis C-methylase UbiE